MHGIRKKPEELERPEVHEEGSGKGVETGIAYLNDALSDNDRKGA